MKKLLIILTVYILFLILALIIICSHMSKGLTFKIDAPSNTDISILVENEPVIKERILLTPITMTTLRPISITIGNQTKKLKVDRLSKGNLIPITVQFQDKTVYYFLQTLPVFFPSFSVKKNVPPLPHTRTHLHTGFVLISLHGLKLTDPSFSFILDMKGNIIYYRGHPEIKKSMFHLKKVVLPNGKVRYITHVQDGWGLDESYVVGYHLIMDEKFRKLDQVKVLKTKKHDALLADEHDILMLDDGHYIVIGQDIIDTTLPNGKKSLITHSVIQEQKDGVVLLDFDGKEHPELQAACYEKCPALHSYNADYIHTNSLFIDPKDSNLLVSSASGYYVMKIDRKNGNILWVLGGKLNQFKMPPEAEFIRQHHVQILSDGRLIMFDNHFSSMSLSEQEYHHQFFENQKAQILILDLDEKNKLVKSAENIPLNFWAPYMGSVQKLDDGNWFIGCGSSDECTTRMIDKMGNVVWDMKADSPYKMFRSYYYGSLK